MANQRRADKKMFGAYFDRRQRGALLAIAKDDGLSQSAVVKRLIMEEARRRGLLPTGK